MAELDALGSAGSSSAGQGDDDRAAEAAAEEAELAETIAAEAERLTALTGVLEGETELASSDLAAAEQDLVALRQAERQTHATVTQQAARRDTLQLSLRRKDGGNALLATPDQAAAAPGLIGSLAASLHVQPGFETAIAAALGPAAEALAIADLAGALAGLSWLAQQDGGQVVLVTADAAPRPDADPDGWPSLPAGCRWARTLVTVPAQLTAVADQLLHRVAVVPDHDAARGVVQMWPDVTAVTVSGESISAAVVRGGSASAPSTIEVQAEADRAQGQVAAAEAAAELAHHALAAGEERRTAAQARVQEVRGQLRQAQAELKQAERLLAEIESSRAAAANRLAQQRGQLAGTARAAEAEVERLRGQAVRAASAQAEAAAVLENLEDQLARAQEAAEQTGGEPSSDERDRLAAVATQARAAETEARLGLRTAEERARAVAGRADQLIARAREERQARERARARAERRERQLAAAQAVRIGAEYALTLLEGSLARAETARHRAETGRDTRDRELHSGREREHQLEGEQSRLVDSAHKDEVARATQRMRIDVLRQRSLEELGIDPDVLVEEYGPHQPIPPSAPAPDGANPVDDATLLPVAHDQPAGAGGVRRAGGAPHLPDPAAGGSEGVAPGPDGDRPRGRRTGRAGLHRGVPRHRPRVRGRVRAVVPRW